MVNLLKWARRSPGDVWGHWPSKAYQEKKFQFRLAGVQQHLAEAITSCPNAAVRVTSLCAGDGRDVIGTLATHPRCGNVRATLFELNPISIANGRAQIEATGLTHVVKFVAGDATRYDSYRKVGRADILLVCGVWGHVPPHERDEMMRAIRGLVQPGGIVIWTRGAAKGAARLEEIKTLFDPPDWKEVRFDITPDGKFAVASYRLVGPGVELPPTGAIFNFC